MAIKEKVSVITKEQVKNMTLAEQAEWLYQRKKDIYDALAKL